jgi:hypothetical protein
MDDRTLTPASHEDLVHSLSYALRYNRSGKRVSERDIMTANAAAEHLAEMLRLSGYVIMQRPPTPAHSAPPPPHAYLYDPERFKPDPND